MRLLPVLVLLFAASPVSAQRVHTFAEPAEDPLRFNVPTAASLAVETALGDSVESGDSVIEGFVLGALGGVLGGIAMKEWMLPGDGGGANENSDRLFLFLTLGLGAAIGSAIDAMM